MLTDDFTHLLLFVVGFLIGFSIWCFGWFFIGWIGLLQQLLWFRLFSRSFICVILVFVFVDFRSFRRKIRSIPFFVIIRIDEWVRAFLLLSGIIGGGSQRRDRWSRRRGLWRRGTIGRFHWTFFDDLLEHFRVCKGHVIQVAEMLVVTRIENGWK